MKRWGGRQGKGEGMSNHALWKMKPLDEWAIVGMNHYHKDGKRFLFVAMTKDGRCITVEGEDNDYLWNRLWHKATANGPTHE